MKNFIKIAITIFSFLIIFLAPVFFIVWQYNLFLPKTPGIEITELSNKEYRDYQEKVLGFLLNKSDLPDKMTQLEKSHLEDVKILFLGSTLVLFFSCLAFLLLVVSTKKRANDNLIWQGLKMASFFSLVIVFLLLFFTLFDFDNLFIYFHEIFFPQGNWLFPSSSLMVQVFPEELFKSLVAKSLVLSSLLALFLALLSFFKIRKIKNCPLLTLKG